MDGLYFVLSVSYFCFERIDPINASDEDLTSDNIHTYLIDNQRTASHRSVIFGIKELNSTEFEQFCSKDSIQNSPTISNRPFYFSSDYKLRTYMSGCYYLDSNNNWQSDGLLVSSSISFMKIYQCIFSI